MNASAILQNQGWRGQGFSLDHSDRGLAKPLLVSRKSDLAGLGSKKNDFGNQWWTDAFDRSLKGLATGATATTSSVPVVRGSSALLAKQGGGLYGGFVKADTLQSTIVVKDMKIGRSTEPGKDEAVPTEPNRVTPTFGVLGVPPAQQAVEEPRIDPVEEKVKTSKKRKLLGGGAEEKTEKTEKKSKKAKKAAPVSDEPSRAIDTLSIGVNGLPPSQASEETASVKKDESKKGKKRKLFSEVGDVESKKTRRKQQGVQTRADPELFPPIDVRETAQTDDVVADFIKFHDPAPPPKSPKVEKVKKVKKAKMTPEQRAELLAEKRTKRKEKATLRKARQEQKAKEKAKQKLELNLRPGPAHPESIAGLRESGEAVQVPGDDPDDETLLAQLIRLLERGQKAQAKELLKAAGTKRQTERKVIHSAHKQAKHWVVVRKNPRVYRPDGTVVPKADVLDPELPELEAKAKLAEKKLFKEQRKQRKAAKFAENLAAKREQREAKRAKARGK